MGGDAPSGAVVRVTPYGPWHPLALRLFRMLDHGHYSMTLEAADHCQALLAAARDSPDTRTLGYVLLARAKALTELGRNTEALRADDELLALHQRTGWQIGEVKVLADSAQGLFTLGRVAEGLNRLGRAVWLLERIAPRGERYVSAVLSVAAAAQAAELYEVGATTLVQLLADLRGDLRGVLRDHPLELYHIEDYYAELLLEWGMRLDHLGQHEPAVGLWERSRTLLLGWQHLPDLEPFSRAMLALAQARLGRFSQALAITESMIQGLREGESYREARLCHLASGVALRGLGDVMAARREFVAAYQLSVYGGSAAERVIIQQETAALALDQEGERGDVLAWALRGHAERLWEFRLQRLATLRQAQQAQQREADRALVDQALLQDPLTALGNRRRFDERLKSLGEDGPPLAGEPLALILMDVDDFKRVNDVHSHPVGDQVLRDIAGVLVANSRTVDVAVRLGGDEFALFLRAGPVEAVEIAERIRHQVAALDWPAVSPGLAVTVSIGIAARTDDESGAMLFAAADAKLYEAKRQGRNRIAS